MQYQHKGLVYSYEPWEDREPDNIKIFHDVFVIERDPETGECEKREVGSMPMSPYNTVRKGIFEMWVDSGMPSIKTMGLKGNATDKDIENYYWKIVDDKIDRMLLLGDN